MRKNRLLSTVTDERPFSLEPSGYGSMNTVTLHGNELSHNCRSEGGYLYEQAGPRRPQHHLWSHTGLHLHPLLFQNLKQTKKY